MQMIAALPALLAIYFALAKTPSKAFLFVYLPTLMLIPNYYRWVVAGAPDPTFNEAAILPIAVIFFAKGGRFKPSIIDALVFAHAACVGYSQYLATGYNDAQNLIFDMIATVVCPYLLAKALIEPEGLRVPFAKQIVTLLFIVAITNAYEFKMISNIYQTILNPFFPGDLGRGWVTTSRNGLGRSAGPFAHAIFAGVIFAVGYRIQRWLQMNGHWPKKQRSRIMTAAMIAGMIFTQSRGPQLGCMFGSIPMFVARAKNRKMILGVILAALIVVGIPTAIVFLDYVSVGRAAAKSETQETAAYRKELIDKYTDIALEHASFGWGLNDWPKVSGMPSIDNHLLLLALRHGMFALTFFVLLVVVQCFRLGAYCARTARDDPGSGLAFTLLGAILSMTFSAMTVFLGEQSNIVLFMMIGWADGLILNKTAVAVQGSLNLAPVLAPLHRFRRVLT
ncbi:MAG TPA: O-antigen ligase family protein [Blastocatellia bacterium]|nr:O-antigen ligase family protein [Blastocatellia bacterium]